MWSVFEKVKERCKELGEFIEFLKLVEFIEAVNFVKFVENKNAECQTIV